jgi:hypothetical protein
MVSGYAGGMPQSRIAPAVCLRELKNELSAKVANEKRRPYSGRRLQKQYPRTKKAVVYEIRKIRAQSDESVV